MNEPSEQELRAFVGRNADYYLTNWQSFLIGGGRGTGFNIAAFLLSGFWFPYRKMWKATFIFYGIWLAETLAEEVLFLGVLKVEAPAKLSTAIGIIAGIICGIGANRWYYSHATSVIGQIRDENSTEDIPAEKLSSRGGTSFFAAAGLFALFMVMIIAIVIGVDLVFGEQAEIVE